MLGQCWGHIVASGPALAQHRPMPQVYWVDIVACYTDTQLQVNFKSQ